MHEPNLISDLYEEFGKRETFSREELFQFLQKFSPTVNETTFRWRIFDLKRKQIIRSISRGHFSLFYKPAYIPELEQKIKKLFQEIKKEFPYVKIAIWNTKWLNELMLHQPGKFLTVIEVENEAKSSVFNYLKDAGHKNVYLEPNEKEFYNYILDKTNSIIVTGLISKSPTLEIDNVNVPGIEKILVDIFSDPLLYASFQGSEMVNIFENVFRKYHVNTTTLYSYATRRNKKNELQTFIISNPVFPTKALI
jgi:hypothetical protein